MEEENQLELAQRIMRILPKFGDWATAIRDFETPYGKLGYRQLAILWALRHDALPADELSPTSLAQHQNVRPSVITRALARLEESGFIERAMDLSDRRRINIAITQRGRDVSVYVEKLYLNEITEAMKHLSNRQVEDLISALATLDEIADHLIASKYAQNHLVVAEEV